MKKLASDLAKFSRKSHAITLCLISIPALLGTVWLAFPLLEARNLGFAFWHFSCEVGVLIAGGGIGCWVAERLFSEKGPSWFTLFGLGGLAVGAIALRFYGDSYWAFDRGYFLD